MKNEALKHALRAAGLTTLDVATRLSVDPKTVERWIAGRRPHPQTRSAIADLLSVDVQVLWPMVVHPPGTGRDAGDILAVYPHRWAVPREHWLQHFRAARSQIDILVYSGLFLVEDAGLLLEIEDAAERGVNVRMLFGNPDAESVHQRGADEGTGDAVAERIRNALVLLRPMLDLSTIQVRLHDSTLYASIFRSDDRLMVNPHIFGVAGSIAPVLLVRRDNDGLFESYRASFEQIWQSSHDV
jgi:transcriptional regulator with XRE-family HTH domain